MNLNPLSTQIGSKLAKLLALTIALMYLEEAERNGDVVILHQSRVSIFEIIEIDGFDFSEM